VMLLSVSFAMDGRVQCRSVVSLIKVVAGRQRLDRARSVLSDAWMDQMLTRSRDCWWFADRGRF
jgi:hypothetical protein